MTNTLEFTAADFIRYFEKKELSTINKLLFVDEPRCLYSLPELNPNGEAADAAKVAIDAVAVPIYVLNAAALPREYRRFIRFDPTARYPVGASGVFWYKANEWLKQSGSDLPPLAMQGELDVLNSLLDRKDSHYRSIYDWVQQRSESERVVSSQSIRTGVSKLYDRIVALAQVPDLTKLQEEKSYGSLKAESLLMGWRKVGIDIHWLNSCFYDGSNVKVN